MPEQKLNTNKEVPLKVLVDQELAINDYVPIQHSLTLKEKITTADSSTQAKEVVPFPKPHRDGEGVINSSESDPIDYAWGHSIDNLGEDYL